MRSIEPLRRAHRWFLTNLDALAAALGEESALSQLITRQNTPCELTITYYLNPLNPEKGVNVTWHSHAVSGVVLQSGAFQGFHTPETMYAAAERLVWLWWTGIDKVNWRRAVKKAVDAAVEDCSSYDQIHRAGEQLEL